ncbi:MAG: hypothetical protein GXP08_05365 [Gammaproteobacteria bacterium]|nr:hypothetical protein [Gammaproteobacteria bacterium]
MHKTIQQGFNSVILATLTVMSAYGPPIIADDTEIFTAHTPINTSANVVFIIDTSGSMSEPPKNAPSDTPKKMQIVKDVFEKLIFDPDNPQDHTTLNPATSGINVAIMRFDNRNGNDNRGGYFISAMKKLNNDNKTSIWDSVNALQADGNTPLAETLYEAALFFNGDEPEFGNDTHPGTNVSGVLEDGRYRSPFQATGADQQCAINNHIVLLTDGQPTHDDDADKKIKDNMDGNCKFQGRADDGDGGRHQNTPEFDNCLPDVAKYLHNKDFFPDDPQKNPNVRTHTIAFDLHVPAAVDLLRETASVGGGLYKPAANATELADAIKQILNTIDNSTSTFVSPSVSLNSANRLQHDSALYYALFKPETSAKWTGNLKAYQLGSDGVLRDYSTPPQSAIDSTDQNQFSKTARSKWSNRIDGNIVAEGGVASKITASRNIYTHDGTNLLTFEAANVSQTSLGVATAAEQAELIQWAKGLDANNNVRRNPIGDPLHSSPVVVDYGPNTGKIIFFGTNEGFLHAIDASTGEEKFAFIPNELLGNLKTFKANTAGVHPYGLDGPITTFVKDADGDGIIESGETYKVYLYIGMRRGGKQYYALDVSNINSPSFLWQINGIPGTGDFAKLGQTWSKPVVTKINTGDKDTPVALDVLLFAGGYDERYDNISATVNNAVGAAIYAVGAIDGELKWLATASGNTSTTGTLALPEVAIPEMTNSIPSDLAVLDLGGTLDHVADRIYAADILGNIFRIDLDNLDPNTNDYAPTGKLFANLSGGNRRFYHSPETVLTKFGLKQYVAINIGSGFRAGPLNTSVTDRFFSIQDSYIYTPLPTSYQAFNTNHLVLASNINTSTVNNKGWYYELTERPGEKILAKSTTINNEIIFTTYTPPTVPNSPSCSPPLGTGRYYIANLFTPNPVNNQRQLGNSGIPPSPSVVFTKGDTIQIEDPDTPGQFISRTLSPNVHLCVGLECETRFSNILLNRTYWRQNL